MKQCHDEYASIYKQERADGLHGRKCNPEGQPARFPGLEDLHEGRLNLQIFGDKSNNSTGLG